MINGTDDLRPSLIIISLNLQGKILIMGHENVSGPLNSSQSSCKNRPHLLQIHHFKDRSSTCETVVAAKHMQVKQVYTL